ncbi:insulinase family protein [Mesorhizobium australicum]|uniref:insulinase family protein n=1 Tax=Mesorhizobium australicum TaxID=536018 RepID=UPI00333A815B
MLWYKVGSADEPPGKSGLAHFLERLIFRATPNCGDSEFDRAVPQRRLQYALTA